MKEPAEHIWKLMDDIGMAMMVTHSGEGDAVRARPMAARVESDDHAIYFLTDAGAPKDDEIAHNSNVCVTFSDTRGHNYVSVSGVAEVFADPSMVEKVWRTTDKNFFKDWNDPNIRVIRIVPDKGEYWEGVGMVAMVASMLKAGATGKRPALGENEKVAM